MPIRTHCAECNAVFQAKDSLAGKRVKCPKCSAPITIGAARSGSGVGAAKGAAAGGRSSSKPAYNPLLGLLDEADVKSATKGPLCPNCSAEMTTGGVICITCGYNIETGKRLRTAVFVDDDDDIVDPTLSDADKIMSKAERDIDDMPISAEGQDFGDGADSFLIATIAGAIALVIVAVGLVIVFTMEAITQVVAPHFISFLAAVVMSIVMAIWITFVAIKQKSPHALVCILTAGLWCIVYGFMQGRQLIVPSIILLACLIIGIASGLGVYYLGIEPVVDKKGM